ncbi:hypothetical protein NC651_009807 [Populus alba x Populus x berolinensis]|nr:hypothetical protein NC651_009807 [Populus alba x Populus x berolinensis]
MDYGLQLWYLGCDNRTQTTSFCRCLKTQIINWRGLSSRKSDGVSFNSTSGAMKQFYHRVFHFQNKQRSNECQPKKAGVPIIRYGYDKVLSKPVEGPGKWSLQHSREQKLMETEESSDKSSKRYRPSYDSSSQGPGPGIKERKTVP